jgi:ABC-2 type transport system ATP-binding protein
MWQMVRELREGGVTIILTTHYIEEAEEMADRIGVIDEGKLILVEEKHILMRKFGRTRVTIGLKEPLDVLPPELVDSRLKLADGGHSLVITLMGEGDGQAGAADFVKKLSASGVDFRSIETARSSLEDIFVGLVGKRP